MAVFRGQHNEDKLEVIFVTPAQAVVLEHLNLLSFPQLFAIYLGPLATIRHVVTRIT